MDWTKEFPAAITVCAADGTVLEMNDRAEEVFQEDGGRRLIGLNALDCHPEPARSKMDTMLKNQSANAYTIEKNGRRKMIFQAPWYEHGEFRGLVEISFEIPNDLPHFIRD